MLPRYGFCDCVAEALGLVEFVDGSSGRGVGIEFALIDCAVRTPPLPRGSSKAVATTVMLRVSENIFYPVST
jgi:hypothetical protein